MSGASDLDQLPVDDAAASRDHRTVGSELPDELDHLRAVVTTSGIAVDEVVLPTGKDIVLDGIRIHYLDWGGVAQQAIVFVHGGGLNAHTWDVICLALRPRFRCYALDLRGHGDSEWSPNLRYAL